MQGQIGGRDLIWEEIRGRVCNGHLQGVSRGQTLVRQSDCQGVLTQIIVGCGQKVDSLADKA